MSVCDMPTSYFILKSDKLKALLLRLKWKQGCQSH